MLLQEIFKPEYADKKEIYGLDINPESSATEYSTPPQNFDTIGFNYVLGEDNLMSDELLDILISYKLTNMNIVLEVPSQLLSSGVLVAKDLIQLASNVDFSISLLPPKHPMVGDTITQEQYISVIKDFLEAMNKKQGFDKFVAPISNFLEYLMLEQLLGQDNIAIQQFKPQNEYVKENFLQYMSDEESNAFKAVIRQSMYDYYGGEQEFKVVSAAIFQGVYKKSQEVFTQHVQSYQQQDNQENTQTPKP